MEVVGWQILNDHLDIVGESDVQAASNVLLSPTDGIGAVCKKLLPDATHGLFPYSLVPPRLHIHSSTSSETVDFWDGERPSDIIMFK